MSEALIIALDSGTSLVKAVAFTETGTVVATSERPNRVDHGAGGAAEQDMARSWDDAATVLSDLAARIEGRSIAALAVTGQGDGTWLVDRDNEPAAPAWLWLDARAADLVEGLRESGAVEAAFAYTGTGLAACNQSAQLLWLQRNQPDILARSAVAMHCKDWLYLRLTGVRATDPAEASFTFGDYRLRDYQPEVLRALGLADLGRLLPPVLDGMSRTHPLTRSAAAATGLPAGLPVVLGYLDTVSAALGSGIYDGAGGEAGVSILGSTGMHLRLVADIANVVPCPAMTGYCMPFPVPGHTLQAQTNMAATLNLDWFIDLLAEAVVDIQGGPKPARQAVLERLNQAVASARPGAAVFHPFISRAGERGPFTDAHARAALLGFDQTLRLPDLARSIYEGLCFAARDCYAALGGVPAEIRVTGGAARSQPMRAILASCLDRPVSPGAQKEAGAAGAAMTAAVAVGVYADMRACAADWIVPRRETPVLPEPPLVALYDALFPIYREGYAAMPDLWRRLHTLREDCHAA